MALSITKNLCRFITPCSRRFSSTNDHLDDTIKMLSNDLTRAGIDYAIVGGNALRVHGFVRLTTDVDVLVAKGDKNRFIQALVGRGYAPRFPTATKKFKNTIYNVHIDVIESGDYPGDGKPKSVSFPDPNDHSFEVVQGDSRVKYLDLQSIVELKLASYQSLPDSRERDKLDVIELVKVTSLDNAFANKLNPSVRDLYLQCYQRARREMKEDLEE